MLPSTRTTVEVLDLGPCPECCSGSGHRKAHCCEDGVLDQLIASLVTPGSNDSPHYFLSDNGGDLNHHYPPVPLYLVGEFGPPDAFTLWRGTFDLADGESGVNVHGGTWGSPILAGIDVVCTYEIAEDGTVNWTGISAALWCGDPSNVIAEWGPVGDPGFTCNPFFFNGSSLGVLDVSCGNYDVNQFGGTIVAG